MIEAKISSLAKEIKKTCLWLEYKANASHVGSSFSIADVLAVLYADILKYDVQNPKYPQRDRLFYSKGHACAALYAVLKEVGFYDTEALRTFNQNGSYFTAHVTHKVPGIELSTGSLGHALPVACGVALAGKIKKADWHVFTIVSDGELDEGSNWEAILFAPHHQLNNLTLIVDYNKMQSFASVKEVLDLAPLGQKFQSFGWQVYEIDGHNHSQIYQVLQKNTMDTLKPRVIIAHTTKGKGIDFMENPLSEKYKSFNKEQLFESALAQIG